MALVLQTKFTCYGDTEEIDITDMKIYHDTEVDQYKKKFVCDDCGKDPVCVCYDSLEEAFSGAMEGYWCDHCSIKNDMLDEPDAFQEVLEMLDEQPKLRRMTKVCEFIMSLLTKEEFDELVRTRRGVLEECTGSLCK